jgi:2-polyprenyl-3-methyl-5-hydroxy-6-metoxy-1,4-benzoquinol methylase
MKITSPVTGLSNVDVITSINKETIITSYENDLGIDVSRFFTEINEILICECRDTGFRFYYPQNTDGDEEFYDELKTQMPLKYGVPYYSEDKWEYGQCLKFIDLTDEVYEIGAGHGAFLRKLKEKGVTNVSGSELNKHSIALAKDKDIDIEYKTIQDKALTSQCQYDTVCTFQVLEHVAGVKSFIDAAIKILKPGGQLIFAVPFNSPYLFGYDISNTLNMPPHHMGLWNEQVFQKLPDFYPIKLQEIIIENLASGGYDFDQFYKINKDRFLTFLPFRKLIDKIYRKYLRKYHYKLHGKNIIAVYKV